jgi:hypothetical protein
MSTFIHAYLPYLAGALGFIVHNTSVRRQLAKHRRQVNAIISIGVRKAAAETAVQPWRQVDLKAPGTDTSV